MGVMHAAAVKRIGIGIGADAEKVIDECRPGEWGVRDYLLLPAGYASNLPGCIAACRAQRTRGYPERRSLPT